MMKRLIWIVPVLAFFLMGAGCTNVPKTMVKQSTFESSVSLSVGDKALFEDGLLIKLQQINDSRCKEGVQCVWEGELAPVFLLSGGEVEKETQLILGTQRQKSGVIADYTVALENVQEKMVSFLVHKTILDDKIRITTPKPGDLVSSPLVITGEARGTWYFEASFPVKIVDANGNVLAITPAQAQGEWMTENFVPFTATLSFVPTTQTGTLILEKDNPSGLPEHADSRAIPVKFDVKK